MSMCDGRWAVPALDELEGLLSPLIVPEHFSQGMAQIYAAIGAET